MDIFIKMLSYFKFVTKAMAYHQFHCNSKLGPLYAAHQPSWAITTFTIGKYDAYTRFILHIVQFQPKEWKLGARLNMMMLSYQSWIYIVKKITHERCIYLYNDTPHSWTTFLY